MSCLGKYVLAIVALSIMSGSAYAYTIGDPAPPLVISEWIKGEPVDLAEGKGKNIYVVEFWATWCPPCRDSIPHLTSIQKKYKDNDVIIIGIADEAAPKVRRYVDRLGENMDYTVAVDDVSKTSIAYQAGFRRPVIPVAFVIDKNGIVAWIGSPLGALDKVLAEVIEGTYDIEARKQVVAARRNLMKYYHLVRQGAAEDAKKLGEECLEEFRDNVTVMSNMAWLILTSEDLPTRDLDLAMRAARAAYDASDGESPFVLKAYARACHAVGEIDKAVEYQKRAIASARDNASREAMSATLEEYLEEAAQSL